MLPIHSHYENLKVARNAPPEVIRAAYRSLSQKYHPDRNLNNPEATRTMVILNAAFETLSDPEKRREHDRWIAETEAASNASSQPIKTSTSAQSDRTYPAKETKQPRSTPEPARKVLYEIARATFIATVIVIAFFSLVIIFAVSH